MSRRTFAAGAATGLLAAAPLALGVAALVDEMGPGLQIECRGLLAGGGVCPFTTGPMRTTPRLVARARWWWHDRRKLPGGFCRRPDLSPPSTPGSSGR